MSEEYKVRDYQSSDYTDIEEISSHIWEGRDYLPHQISFYHKDPKSYPLVLEVDGKVVSVGNGRLLNSEIMWLEALRTHPDYRGRGFGMQITYGHLEKLRKIAGKEAWLLTANDNNATRKILSRIGFVEDTLLQRIRLDLSDTELLEKISNENTIIWDLIKTRVDLQKITTLLHQKKQFSELLGEFRVFPVDSWEVDKYISSSDYYFNEKICGIALFTPSDEHEEYMTLNTIGTLTSKELLESLSFFLTEVDKEAYTHLTVFLSPEVEIPSLFQDIKLFRFMRFALS